MNIVILLILIITGVIYLLMAINFIIKLRKFKFFGSKYFYIVIPYLICLVYSLYLNFNPIVPPETESGPWVLVASSLFDSLKMIAVAFDRTVIGAYFFSGSPYNFAFGIGYLLSSILALAFASLGIIVGFIISFRVKFLSIFFELTSKRKRIYYIFTDSKNKAAIRLGHELNSNKDNIIRFVIARSSLKTQDGTEFRDELMGLGFEVITENHSVNYCKYLMRRFLSKKFGKLYALYPLKYRKIRMFGLFSEDESSSRLAHNFKTAVEENGCFKKYIKGNCDNLSEKDIEKLESLKIFITYQNADIDINNNYSSSTFHIVNTLSQYDIVSTEFIMDNPINQFIDLNNISDNDNKGLNVTLIGLGKINRPILNKMICGYQLWGDNINKINYHILDRDAEELVDALSNEYTGLNDSPKEYDPPLLYRIDGWGNGKDLSEYSVLEKYFVDIKDNIKTNHRFEANGFEVFVISICDTNTDIKIAINLRKILSKIFDKENLNNVYIFVRIGNKFVSNNFIEGNAFAFNQKQFYLRKKNAPLELEKENNNPNKDNSKIRSLTKEIDMLNDLPIIVFGENALMSKFVDVDYQVLDKIALSANVAYSPNKTYLQVNRSWLKNNKIGVLENVNTAYSLKPKLKLLGYLLTDEYKIEKDLDNKNVTYYDEDAFKDIYQKIVMAEAKEYNELDENMKKLIQLEHNRWTASSFIIHKYGQLSIKEYLNSIYKDENGNIKDSTKNVERSKHVCMLTNKDLLELGNKISNLDLKDGDKTQNKIALTNHANKLVFLNDLNGMKYMFDALKETNK